MKKRETNFVQKALSRERKKGERGVLSSNDWLKKPSMAHCRILTYLPTYPLVPKLPTWAFFPSQFYSSLSHSLHLSLPILSVLSRGSSSSSSVNEGQRGRRRRKKGTENWASQTPRWYICTCVYSSVCNRQKLRTASRLRFAKNAI